ncbi:MAG: DHH family phosphoesterase [Methanomassiliicoccus sp.]|nr:DHH family phosphoesterase [Methanomassiliicoccus sp.]
MLSAIAKKLMSGKKVVLLHGNADPDALGSAYALYRSFPDVTVAALGGLDRLAKVMAINLEFEVESTVDLDQYDVVVAVDSSSRDQIGIDVTGRDVVAIDHHSPCGDWDDEMFYCDEGRRSCAEIIFELLRVAGSPVDRPIGLALAVGMITDSGHFRFANSALLRTFSEVMETSGINMDEAMDLTDLEPDVSERISQLKGAQRMRFDRLGDHIVAISLGSAHESSVCKSMLGIGADVAFVGSQRDERFRISARARQSTVRKGFHLGKLLDQVGGETSNSGGGHAGAAGLTGVGDVEAVLNMCMARTMDFFREQRRAAETRCDQ